MLEKCKTNYYGRSLPFKFFTLKFSKSSLHLNEIVELRMDKKVLKTMNSIYHPRYKREKKSKVSHRKESEPSHFTLTSTSDFI